MRTEISHAEVLRRFDYNPETGILSHRVRTTNRIKVGDPVGHLHSSGYLTTAIDGKAYRLHRLIWFYVTGRWPDHDVDHEDNNRANNAWDNLREGTRTQNLHNMRAKNPASGFKGVLRRDGSFSASIRDHGKRIHLGSFRTGKEAAEAYDAAATALFGEFAKTNKALGLLDQEYELSND